MRQSKADSRLVRSQQALVAMVIYFQVALTEFSVLGLIERPQRLGAATVCTQRLTFTKGIGNTGCRCKANTTNQSIQHKYSPPERSLGNNRFLRNGRKCPESPRPVGVGVEAQRYNSAEVRIPQQFSCVFVCVSVVQSRCPLWLWILYFEHKA